MTDFVEVGSVQQIFVSGVVAHHRIGDQMHIVLYADKPTYQAGELVVEKQIEYCLVMPMDAFTKAVAEAEAAIVQDIRMSRRQRPVINAA